MTGWLTVIQQMLGRGGLTNCFNSNQLLLLSGGTPHTTPPTLLANLTFQRAGEKIAHVYKYLCVHVWLCVCAD